MKSWILNKVVFSNSTFIRILNEIVFLNSTFISSHNFNLQHTITNPKYTNNKNNRLAKFQRTQKVLLCFFIPENLSYIVPRK